MANRSTPYNSDGYTGWFKNDVDGTLDLYRAGTKIAAYSAALDAVTGAITASTTITAGTGLTVTTGNSVNTAGDIRVTAGNFRAGVVSTFGTTEPTSAIVMKQGTAFAGAITTSGGIQSDATTLQKIIAAGTVNNVET